MLVLVHGFPVPLDPNRPDQGLPPGLPGSPAFPGNALPGGPNYPTGGPVPPGFPTDPGWGGGWGGGNYPGQGLPWFPGRPDQGLPWGPNRPDNSLPGGHVPWWILPLLIAQRPVSSTPEGSIPPTHPEKPDPTKPGYWLLVAVAPGDFKFAWVVSEVPPPTLGTASKE